jgi:inorganic phosphate transporter, PiT family
MLVVLFTAALVWNVGTWWFGIPNSSSLALIEALIGIAIETALTHGRGMKDGVEWHRVCSVPGSLLIWPLAGASDGSSNFGAAGAPVPAR